MPATKQRVITADKIVEIETTVIERNIDWNDINGYIEVDEFHNEAPWESCDGWEHEFVSTDNLPFDVEKARGYVWSNDYSNRGLIVIDDATVENVWGCGGYPGCSKQVHREAVAAAKRKAIDQLAKWYKYGWTWYTAVAEYDDKMECVGGIDDDSYAEEVVDEMKDQVAYELEKDGYIVVNRPAPPKRYTPAELFQQRIERNLSAVI